MAEIMTSRIQSRQHPRGRRCSNQLVYFVVSFGAPGSAASKSSHSPRVTKPGVQAVCSAGLGYFGLSASAAFTPRSAYCSGPFLPRWPSRGRELNSHVLHYSERRSRGQEVFSCFSEVKRSGGAARYTNKIIGVIWCKTKKSEKLFRIKGLRQLLHQYTNTPPKRSLLTCTRIRAGVRVHHVRARCVHAGACGQYFLARIVDLIYWCYWCIGVKVEAK